MASCIMSKCVDSRNLDREVVRREEVARLDAVVDQGRVELVVEVYRKHSAVPIAMSKRGVAHVPNSLASEPPMYIVSSDLTDPLHLCTCVLERDAELMREVRCEGCEMLLVREEYCGGGPPRVGVSSY